MELELVVPSDIALGFFSCFADIDDLVNWTAASCDDPDISIF